MSQPTRTNPNPNDNHIDASTNQQQGTKRVAMETENILNLSGNNDDIAPLKLAIDSLSLMCRSLPRPLQPFFTIPGEELINLIPKIQHHKSLLKKMKDEKEKIPTSARTKFSLKASTTVSETEAFKELAADTERLVKKFQQDLKQRIQEVQELEVKHREREYHEKYISICETFTNAYFIWHKYPKASQNHLHAILLRVFSSSTAKIAMLNISPTSVNNMLARRFGEDIEHLNNQPHNIELLTHAQNIEKTIREILHASVEKYFSQQERLELIKELNYKDFTQKVETVTAQTQERMDIELPIDSQRMKDLINDQVSKKTRILEQKIQSLTAQIQNQKNQARGGPSTASEKKKNDTGAKGKKHPAAHVSASTVDKKSSNISGPKKPSSSKKNSGNKSKKHAKKRS